ncbi:MAG: hypothetical protein ACK5L5_03080 [Bacteroidales bacterium]
MSNFDINKFNEKETFRVPKGYFKEFEARLERRLQNDNDECSNNSKGRLMPLNILKLVVVASVFFLIFKLVGYFTFDLASDAYYKKNKLAISAKEKINSTDDLYYYYASEMSDSDLINHQINSTDKNSEFSDNEAFEYLLATLDDYDIAKHY